MSDSFPILLLDDEQAEADMLRQALKAQFPQASLVHFARFADALAYIDQVTSCTIGLILVDIDRHGEPNDLAFVHVLRQHQHCRSTPVLVFSSQNRADWLESAYDQWVNSYTIKPYSYTEWKQYADVLRSYWYETVTTPNQISKGDR